MTAIATATLTAAKFGRIVRALARQFDGLTVGAEWLFMIADGIDVVAWVPRAGHLTLQLGEFDGPALRTVTVCPGVERTFDVITDAILIGETRGIEAALSIALDHLTAPLAANAQNTHDAFAV
jgi:hypothetical protein